MGVVASCTDCIFLLSVFSMAWHLGPGCQTTENTESKKIPPGISPPLPCRETAFRMQTSESTVLLGGLLGTYWEAPSCSSCLCSRRHFPLPDHPRGRSQTTDSPQTPAPAETIQLVHPNPAYSAWPCLSRGNHNEGSRPPFPLASSTPSTDPGASPCGPAGHGGGEAVLPPLGNWEWPTAFPWRPLLIVSLTVPE